MEGIVVLNTELPKTVKAVTVIKGEKDYYIILNNVYDEWLKKKFLNEELHKINKLINN